MKMPEAKPAMRYLSKIFCPAAGARRLLKKSNRSPEVHSAAKAAVENGPLIAALKCVPPKIGGVTEFFSSLLVLLCYKLDTFG
jgi:hypothetical protein